MGLLDAAKQGIEGYSYLWEMQKTVERTKQYRQVGAVKKGAAPAVTGGGGALSLKAATGKVQDKPQGV